MTMPGVNKGGKFESQSGPDRLSMVFSRHLSRRSTPRAFSTDASSPTQTGGMKVGYVPLHTKRKGSIAWQFRAALSRPDRRRRVGARIEIRRYQSGREMA